MSDIPESPLSACCVPGTEAGPWAAQPRNSRGRWRPGRREAGVGGGPVALGRVGVSRAGRMCPVLRTTAALAQATVSDIFGARAASSFFFHRSVTWGQSVALRGYRLWAEASQASGQKCAEPPCPRSVTSVPRGGRPGPSAARCGARPGPREAGGRHEALVLPPVSASPERLSGAFRSLGAGGGPGRAPCWPRPPWGPSR